MIETLKNVVLNALDDIKAYDVSSLEVKDMTPITDYMIIATGTSTTHIKAIADNVVSKVKDLALQPLGVEGKKGADWILIDLGDIVIHVMLANSREFYALDKLWSPMNQELSKACSL
jgi:ribosome-associated protein